MVYYSNVSNHAIFVARPVAVGASHPPPIAETVCLYIAYPLWERQGIEMRRTCSSRSPVEKDRMSLVTDGLSRRMPKYY
jgi:hypothetical protein